MKRPELYTRDFLDHFVYVMYTHEYWFCRRHLIPTYARIDKPNFHPDCNAGLGGLISIGRDSFVIRLFYWSCWAFVGSIIVWGDSLDLAKCFVFPEKNAENTFKFKPTLKRCTTFYLPTRSWLENWTNNQRSHETSVKGVLWLLFDTECSDQRRKLVGNERFLCKRGLVEEAID